MTAFSGGCDGAVKMWNVTQGPGAAQVVGMHEQPVKCVYVTLSILPTTTATTTTTTTTTTIIGDIDDRLYSSIDTADRHKNRHTCTYIEGLSAGHLIYLSNCIYIYLQTYIPHIHTQSLSDY